MGTPEQKQCCCRWGDAVSGEWPEWECWDCPIHGNGLDVVPEHRCRRHKREAREAVPEPPGQPRVPHSTLHKRDDPVIRRTP